jgi:hypothetical protein
MSLRVARRIVAAFLAFVLLSASDCGGTTFSDIVTGHSALITVKNTSSETVVVLLYADDAYNAGAVTPNGSPTITTHIDGAYNVVVIGQGQKVADYNTSLRELKLATGDFLKAYSASQSVDLGSIAQRQARAKQQLAAIRQPDVALASCSGSVQFPTELKPSPRPIEIGATIARDASGAWSATCPGS